MLNRDRLKAVRGFESHTLRQFLKSGLRILIAALRAAEQKTFPLGRDGKERRLSQDKLSRLADVAHATIIKIELGGIQSPTIDTVQKSPKR